MNKKVVYILLIFLLIACGKIKNEDNTWVTIDFKTNYTIQVPKSFVGYGLGGFEGPVFYKSSDDGKIQLMAGYCNSLHCFDFGDTLKNPIPETVQIVNNYSKKVTLNQIEYFKQNSVTVGILYFSQTDTVNGRLYWKDDGTLKRTLEVEFTASKLDTVKRIISSIRRK